MRRVTHVVSVAIGVGIIAAGIVLSAGHHTTAVRAERSPTPRVATPLSFSVKGRDQAFAAYANLPLAFVENRGQIDQRVRYYAQRGSFAAYFTAGQIVFSFGKLPPSRPAKQARILPAALPAAKDQASNSVTLALRFVQANPQVSLEAEERAPGEVSYFRGNDPARWQTALPQYSQIVYRGLWAGVDLRLRDRARSLKYEFRVRPGAPVSNIRLAYTGASGVTLDRSGALRIDTAAGVLRDAPPVAYQEIDGARVPVESRYVVNAAAGEYGFAIGAGYRPDRELIIDPGLDYSTFLGGGSLDSGAAIAVDAAGSAYIVGITQSADFPTTAGAFARTGAVGSFTDVFVTKLNPTGTALVYSTFIGGSDLDWGRAIAIDAAGNAYIAGQTKSSNFPTTPGAFDRTLNIPNCPRCAVDNYDAFVAKLNPSGSALVYSTYLGGGTDIDDALGIAVDSAGSAYVAGEAASADFPVTPGAFQTVRNGADDAYVTKLNPAGSALVYSTFIGGAAVDFGVRIVVDASHNAYVLGNTSSADFPATAGAFDTSQNGGFDLFVLKLNAAGSGLIYSTFLGGSNMELAGGLAVDSAGNAYVTGSTLSLDFPITSGAFKTVSDGNDGFVAKLNPTGSALVYSTLIGGSATDGVSGVAIDASGNAFLTGNTSSKDFPTTVGSVDSTYNGGAIDVYVAELSADGSTLLYGTYLGGAGSDSASDLALGPAGSVLVTGQTMSSDFPTTAGAFARVRNGNPLAFAPDAFVARLTPVSGPPSPASLSSLSVNPVSVLGGSPSGGTVALTAAAPTGGAVVALSSDNAAASVPASLTISQGSSATFPITTSPVASPTTATITATYNSVSTTATLTLAAPPPPVSLQAVTVFPASITGGSASQGVAILSGPAPAAFPVTITSSSTSASVPSTVTVLAGSNTADFTITTSPVGATTAVTITASAGSVTTTTTLTLTPAPPPSVSLQAVSVNPATITGGSASQGAVILSGTTPAAFPVAITSSSTSALVASIVTVQPGSGTANFAIITSSVATPAAVTITASAGGVTSTTTLTLNPAPSVSLQTVTVTPASITGGSASQGVVTLSGPALAAFPVSITSSSTSASVPSIVTVQPGSSTANFTIASSSVAAPTAVTITASAGGVTHTATLTLNPAGQTAVLTVKATGRTGERVTSTPAGISVAVGSSMSGSFNLGTSVTLTASNNRSAVWSGACSSGGKTVRTCTFTLNANASVTADIH